MAHRAPAPQDEITWLQPAVQGSAAKAIGWIGGAPCLPPATRWPRHGTARFLAQVNMAALPQGLWRGYGPRSGWLRVFLDPDGTPQLVHTQDKGLPAAIEDVGDAGPAWPLAPVATAPEMPPAPEFDLDNPACQPVDLGSARMLLAAIGAELDRAQAFLDLLDRSLDAATPQDRPGANGIWGRILRNQSAATPRPRVIANPGVLVTGRKDIAAARDILARLGEALDRARDPLPDGAVALLCDALRDLRLPIFLSEPAPDIAIAPGEADPIRIFQRDVPVTRSARAPAGMPGSDWAERWQAALTARALHLLPRRPETLTETARAAWTRAQGRAAAAARCALGDVRDTVHGPVAVVMRLPATPLTGWNWDAEALEICLPLQTLAEGDFRQPFALWPDAVDQAQ